MGNKIDAVLGKTGLGKMTSSEYQANLNGLNMFFGAVLGFVLTGTETLDTWQFGFVLMMLASAVISILGFYPEITDGCKRVENFNSCLATLRRILGLWNRSMYSNTSALAASSVGYLMR